MWMDALRALEPRLAVTPSVRKSVVTARSRGLGFRQVLTREPMTNPLKYQPKIVGLLVRSGQKRQI